MTRLAVVTNQGVPVHAVVVAAMRDQEAIVSELRKVWGLLHKQPYNVLTRPVFASGYALDARVPMKIVEAWVDALKEPRYILTIIQADTPQSENVPPPNWKFCPYCGCSWLSHLLEQTDIDVADWSPCVCSDCGCRKAVEP